MLPELSPLGTPDVFKPRLVLALAVAALIAWLFGSAPIGRTSLVFRDAAHFYHPLFEWTRGEWGAGRVPLWNPYENLGVPLVGENTSSVFYPGKLLFALPLDFTLLYNWYVLAHLALAAGTAYALAAPLPHRLQRRRAGGNCLCLLRQRAIPMLQRRVPGRRRLVTPGRARGRPNARRSQPVGRRGPRRDLGHDDHWRRPANGLQRRIAGCAGRLRSLAISRSNGDDCDLAFECVTARGNF